MTQEDIQMLCDIRVYAQSNHGASAFRSRDGFFDELDDELEALADVDVELED